jgi:hypothetical protein
VLLHDVQLLFYDLVGDVERTAAAVATRRGSYSVLFDLEMHGNRLAPRRLSDRLRLWRSLGLRRRLGSRVEPLFDIAVQDGRGRRKFLGRRLTLPALRSCD